MHNKVDPAPKQAYGTVEGTLITFKDKLRKAKDFIRTTQKGDSTKHQIRMLYKGNTATIIFHIENLALLHWKNAGTRYVFPLY